MAKAIWNGEIIAESKKAKQLDGKYYFPQSSIKKEFFKKSYTHHIDLNKGKANFFNLHVQNKVSWNAAWYYPNPRKQAEKIKDHVTFNGDVEVK